MGKLKDIAKIIVKKSGFNLEKSKLFSTYKHLTNLPKLDRDMYLLEQVNAFPVMKFVSDCENKKTQPLVIYIFSYDRALQLDALLGSISDNVENANSYPIYIQYRYSTNEHRKSFEEVFTEHKNLQLHTCAELEKGDFSKLLVENLSQSDSENVMFLVDDIVFTEKIHLNEFNSLDTTIFIPSLRLGANITYCYTSNTPETPPAFTKYEKVTESLNISTAKVWKWREGDQDWGQMFSVDGNIYNREEFLFWLENITYRNPFSLEAGLMGTFNQFYKNKLGICYEKSKIINLPVNHVLTDSLSNRYGNIHQDDLLKEWQKGNRMNYKKLYGAKNNGVHEELPFEFCSRK